MIQKIRKEGRSVIIHCWNYDTSVRMTECEMRDLFWRACDETCGESDKIGLMKLCLQDLLVIKMEDRKKMILDVDCSNMTNNNAQVRDIIQFWKKGEEHFARIDEIKTNRLFKDCKVNWDFRITLPNDYHYDMIYKVD